MTDYVQNLDALSLLTVEAGMSFAISAFTSPSYNFPLFLFGIYAQERTEPADSLRLFTGMLGVSVIIDFVWLFRNEQYWFIKGISILILIFKVPTFFATQRGASPITFPGGETVWSMPGGFSSGNQGAYQTLGDDIESGRPVRPAPPQTAPPPPAPVIAQAPASTAYQSS